KLLFSSEPDDGWKGGEALRAGSPDAVRRGRPDTCGRSMPGCRATTTTPAVRRLLVGSPVTPGSHLPCSDGSPALAYLTKHRRPRQRHAGLGRRARDGAWPRLARPPIAWRRWLRHQADTRCVTVIHVHTGHRPRPPLPTRPYRPPPYRANSPPKRAP